VLPSHRIAIVPAGILLITLTVFCGANTPPAVPKPKQVTLPSDKQPLSKLLDDLARQTGVRVEDQRGEPEPTLAVKIEKATFWQALDALAEASDSRVSLHARGGKIALVLAGPSRRRTPVSHDGFFRSTLRRVVVTHELETGTVSYTAALEVAWEPALQPLLLETHPREPRLQDDKGNPVPMTQEGSSLAPVDGQIALAFDVPLSPLARSCDKIGLFDGKLVAVAPSKMLDFTFDRLDRLDKDINLRSLAQEGVTCRISKLILAKDRWTVQVSLDYPPGGVTLESYQSWVVNNEMTLVSPDRAKRLDPAGYVLESSTPRRAVLSYHFKDDGRSVRGKPEDWKVVYRTPAALVELPFTFSFKDVPLQ
jgi:hypothetical protein